MKAQSNILVSGFTYVMNAELLDFPVVESILSVLPICDEFVVACGRSRDNTRSLIESINSPKIRIIDTVWEPEKFKGGLVHSVQANIALHSCSGDWAIYLQADEVIHERYLPVIKRAIEKYHNDERVEGFLFSYKHFWGDYEHYQTAHNWYRREVRVVRNKIGVEVYGDGQGFRLKGRKLNVILIPAEIYHYGWVRDPRKMRQKIIVQDTIHHNADWVDKRHPSETRELPFQYGTLKHLARFTGTHPKVMEERIKSKNWTVDESVRSSHKHNRLLIRILSFIENRILHTRIGEYRDYKIIGVDREL
jgi:hypothetical protein